MKQMLLACLAVLTLPACSGPADPPSDDPAAAGSSVIGDPLQQSLDTARSVEDLNAGRRDQLEGAVDSAN